MQPGIYQVVNAYAAGCLLTAIGTAGLVTGAGIFEKIVSTGIIVVGIGIVLGYYSSQLYSIKNWHDRPENYR